MNQEKLYYCDKPSWLNQIGSFSSLLILMLMPLFIQDMGIVLVAINIQVTFLIICAIVYSRFSWKFTISDNDIQSHHGLMVKEHKCIYMKDLRDINVKQTTLQRISGVGDVVFSTAGSSEETIIFCGIKSPFELKNNLLQM